MTLFYVVINNKNNNKKKENKPSVRHQNVNHIP
jgi:hypothetical protein